MASKSKSKRYTTVSIPSALADKARSQIEGTGFMNLSDYVTFILREIVAGREDFAKSAIKSDEEKIKEKLRKLGYL